MVIQTADVDLNAVMGLSPAPSTPVTTELAGKLTLAANQPGGVDAIDYRAELSPELRAKTEATAKAILPSVLKNPALLDNVGTPALDEINGLAADMFHMFLSDDRIKIPELNQYTKELGKAVRGFTAKNDRNAKRREAALQYERNKAWITDFLNRNVDWLRELIDDAKGMERRIDGIEAQIIDKRAQLTRNVELCNQLLAGNERAIVNLVLAIATMQSLHDIATDAHDAISIDPSDPRSREKSFEKEQVRAMIEALEVRTSEFKQRYLVAVGTSPQVLNSRTLSYALSQRLGMIITLTIPAFKLTVVQWAMMIEAQQGAQVTQGAIDFNNEVIQGWAKASATGVESIATVVQTPSTSPESIMAIAQSLDAQVASFDKAYQIGVQKRAEVDRSIVKARGIIVASPDKRSAIVRELAAATPVEMPAVPTLPTEVTELIPEIVAQAR